MGKNLQYKILLSLLAAGSISVYGFVNTAAAAIIYETQIPDNTHKGKYYTANDTVDGVLKITGNIPAEVDKGIVGKYFEGVEDNTKYTGNKVIIDGVDFTENFGMGQGFIAGVFLYEDGDIPNNVEVTDNHVIINGKNGNINISDMALIAGAIEDTARIKSYLHDNTVYIDSINSCSMDKITGAMGYYVQNNKTIIKDSDITISWDSISGGNAAYGEEGEFANNNNTVEIINSTINLGYGYGIIGGYAVEGDAKNNKVIISGDNTVINCNIYGGIGGLMVASGTGEVSGNSITLKDNANLSQAELFGGYNAAGTDISGNKLIIDGWTGQNVKGAYNFSDIDFTNINWVSNGTVLNITNNDKNGALANTMINHDNVVFSGGTKLKTGDSMTLVAGDKLSISADNVSTASKFTAGVAIEGTGMAEVASDGNSVKYTLTKVKHTDQIDLVAENRAVAAAFVNQGTDLISDSLDTISRDSNYGVKTFAAVHGNRSKYDVNSDIKINGWSTIVGVGNADKFDNGSEFSWGVFYENGSGNYRTYNEFNNEFFRGDGSLVYNGAGIAARYTNKNGVYTEGSLRAGMLKSDMDNALRDGAGNFYGYESESAYYGAHIGIGKIISLSESSDLDVYGKFFHTYTEGDSFKVAGDEFEFDSINSDRLRIGARITSNKENKFSTYYGLAYEYEFNGNADMTAQGLKAPTQSLQGSSVMAEVGFNYQPTPTSPWSFDLNMRGYTGERQGGSFNVQATYTFYPIAESPNISEPLAKLRFVPAKLCKFCD